MALVKYGAVVTEASGSLDGVTYSRNTFGAYVRARGVPVNPNTGAQANARSRLSSLSQQWRGLTQSQRNQWSVTAASVSLVNPLGETYNPTGQQLYVGQNINLLLTGGSTVSTPNSPDAAPELVDFEVGSIAPGPPGNLNLEWTSLVGTGTFLVYATPPISAGINYFKSSLFRLIGDFDQTATSPTDFITEYRTVFSLGSGDSGSKIAVKIRPISANGYAGAELIGNSIVS